MKYIVAVVVFTVLGVGCTDVNSFGNGYNYAQQDGSYHYNQPSQDVVGYNYQKPAPQQTYLPPVSQPQANYLPPAAQPQANYLPPAAQPQANYLPPAAQPQEYYLPPASQPQQQYIPPVAQPQQHYIPPVSPLQPQQNYLPPNENTAQDGYHYRTVKQYRLRAH